MYQYPEIELLQKKINQADEVLSEIQSFLYERLNNLTEEELAKNSESAIHQIQLTLQFRMDTQDALVMLFQIEQSILQVLGIESKNEAKINLERLQYALGHEDLKKILHALNLLLETLMKVASRNNQHLSKRYQNELTQKLHSVPISSQLQKAVENQQRFNAILVDFSHHLKQLVKRGPVGPVLDHIASMRGPISHFYQALQNGLMSSYQLYQKFSRKVGSEYSIEAVLKQAETLLQNISLSHAQPKLFTPNIRYSEDRLEKRAEKRRLGHFFRL